MQVFLTRDSVAAGDDADAPHNQTITVADYMSVEDIVAQVARSGYLASIGGGKATWSASSRYPLAVVAQEWDKPKLLYAFKLNKLDYVENENALYMHFTYYAQLDPQIVYETLRRLVGTGLNLRGR